MLENEQDAKAGKFVLWAGGGCLILMIGMVLGCVLGVGGIVWLTLSPENVTVSVDAPIQIDNGDKVEFTVNVTNDGTDTIEIVGVNIGAEYLDGIAVDSATPAYTDVLPPDETAIGEALQYFYFSIPVAPGESASITFSGAAIAPGDYGGSLDVYVDSDFSCIPKVIRTVVK
jgi:uncharacterized repeat protein (TIGR01451 family)